MATTESTPKTGGPQAARPDIVVLVDAASRTERELIEAWAPRVYPGAELVAHEPAPLAGRLERGDDPLIVPARVTWFPSSREPKGSRLGDLRALQPAPAAPRPPADRAAPVARARDRHAGRAGPCARAARRSTRRRPGARTGRAASPRSSAGARRSPSTAPSAR